MDTTPVQRQRATLADVASASGVSKSIASRVLNGDPAVSVREETRVRVLSTAAGLNYRPNSFARGLRLSSTGVLAFLIPDLTNPVITRVLRGAVDRARELDMTVLVFEDKSPLDSADLVVELHQSGRIDGIMVASAVPGHPLVEQLRATGIPHVFVNRGVSGSNRNVILDDGTGAQLAVDHLRSWGHERIAHIAGPSNIDNSNRRAAGFMAGVAAHPGSVGTVVHAAFDYAAGDEAARDLFSGAFRPTAILTSSLQQAIGVLHAANHFALDIPRDLSVVATDELPLADYLVPSLTTVGQPTAQLGEAAVDALAEQMKAGEFHDVLVGVSPTVTQRRSTGPAPVSV